MKKIKLEVVQIQYSQTQSGAYALVLEDTKGKRRIPIIIGGLEAQAIAVELERMKPSRPLTHDLFKPIFDEFGLQVTEVIIYNLVEGIFYAKIICSNGEKEVEIDSRTSDAIAIALRFECPIYTFDFIVSSAGISLEDEDSQVGNEEGEEDITDEDLITEYSRFTDVQLDEMLNKALENEDYEKASRIRDEMHNRNK
ncbi:MAG: bifunctional nuclease domain-containing protein [Bacteroidota bacterium]|jgi:bifunctional DNase/RNase